MPINFNGIFVVSPSGLFVDYNEPLIEPQDLNLRKFPDELTLEKIQMIKDYSRRCLWP